MRTADVLQHFGSSLDTAKALDITRQAVEQWGELVPEGTAYKIQVITGGRLQVDPSLYKPRHRRAEQTAKARSELG